MGLEQTESQWTPDTGNVDGDEERSATQGGHWGFSWVFIEGGDFIDAVVFMVVRIFCKGTRIINRFSTFSEKDALRT